MATAESGPLSTFLLRSFIKSKNFHPSGVKYCLEEQSVVDLKQSKEFLENTVLFNRLEVKPVEKLDIAPGSQAKPSLSYQVKPSQANCSRMYSDTHLESLGLGYCAVVNYEIVGGEYGEQMKFDFNFEVKDLVSEQTVCTIQKASKDSRYSYRSTFAPVMYRFLDPRLDASEGVLPEDRQGTIELTETASYFEVKFRGMVHRLDKHAVELDAQGLAFTEKLGPLILPKPALLEVFLDKHSDRYERIGARYGLQINGLLRTLLSRDWEVTDQKVHSNFISCLETLKAKLKLLKLLVIDAIYQVGHQSTTSKKLQKIKNLVIEIADCPAQDAKNLIRLLRELAVYDWDHLMRQISIQTDSELIQKVTMDPATKSLFEKAHISVKGSEFSKILGTLVIEKFEIVQIANYHSNQIRTLESKLFVVTTEADHFRFRKTTQSKKDSYLVFHSEEIEKNRGQVSGLFGKYLKIKLPKEVWFIDLTILAQKLEEKPGQYKDINLEEFTAITKLSVPDKHRIVGAGDGNKIALGMYHEFPGSVISLKLKCLAIGTDGLLEGSIETELPRESLLLPESSLEKDGFDSVACAWKPDSRQLCLSVLTKSSLDKSCGLMLKSFTWNLQNASLQETQSHRVKQTRLNLAGPFMDQRGIVGKEDFEVYWTEIRGRLFATLVQTATTSCILTYCYHIGKFVPIRGRNFKTPGLFELKPREMLLPIENQGKVAGTVLAERFPGAASLKISKISLKF